MKFRGEVLSEEDVFHFVKHFEDLRRSLYHLLPETNSEKYLLGIIKHDVELSQEKFNELLKEVQVVR